MRTPSSHWIALVELLPSGTDLKWFEAEFARIETGNRASLERQQRDHLDIVRACDDALAKLPQLVDRDSIIAHRVAHQTQAGLIARQLLRWRVWRIIEVLILAKRAGVSLAYTSEPTAENPRPHGPGIDYLCAAAKVLENPFTSHTACRWLKLHGRAQPMTAVFHGGSTFRADLK
jgi:hypothetical protein